MPLFLQGADDGLLVAGAHAAEHRRGLAIRAKIRLFRQGRAIQKILRAGNACALRHTRGALRVVARYHLHRHALLFKISKRGLRVGPKLVAQHGPAHRLHRAQQRAVLASAARAGQAQNAQALAQKAVHGFALTGGAQHLFRRAQGPALAVCQHKGGIFPLRRKGHLPHNGPVRRAWQSGAKGARRGVLGRLHRRKSGQRLARGRGRLPGCGAHLRQAHIARGNRTSFVNAQCVDARQRLDAG